MLNKLYLVLIGNKWRPYCTVTVVSEWGWGGCRGQRSWLTGEAVNSSGGLVQHEFYLWSCSCSLGHGCQEWWGVVTVPTGIRSWSRGQGSRGWDKGLGLWVWRGVGSTGGTLPRTGHTCPACQSTSSHECVVTVSVFLWMRDIKWGRHNR